MKKLLTALSVVIALCSLTVTALAKSTVDAINEYLSSIPTGTWIAIIAIIILLYIIRDISDTNKSLLKRSGKADEDKNVLQKEIDTLRSLHDADTAKIKQLEREVFDGKCEISARSKNAAKLSSELDELREKIRSQELTIREIGEKALSHYEKFQPYREYTVDPSGGFDAARIGKGLAIDHSDINNVKISAKIKSASSNEIYTATLTSCTCVDWQYHRRPCKHMYALAAHVGILGCRDEDELISKIRELALLSEKTKQEQEGVSRIIKSKSQSFPAVGRLFEKLYFDLDEHRRSALLTKDKPAPKAADTVRQISREKRALEARCKSLDYQLTYLKALFPWIEEFVDKPPFDSTVEEITSSEASTISHSEDYVNVRKWLSIDEYQHLSPVEKYQLALERYVARKDKNSWDAGVEYEQYVGYLCEARGCSVEYTGAINGLDDMGRDLIAKIGSTVYIIQCKRWHDSKSIHEKHIFQLFGSVTLYKHEFPSADCRGVFITTTALSQRAADIARSLNITVYQNFPFDDSYPRIKCNVSKSGEKIYHLPFDQQYNSVKIEYNRGECYVGTASDAEALGFRKALRHNAQNVGS